MLLYYCNCLDARYYELGGVATVQGLNEDEVRIVNTFIRARERHILSLAALKDACHDMADITPSHAAILSEYGLVSYDPETQEVVIPPDVRILAQTILMGEDVAISPMYSEK
jgi:hypothetical protein